jgi:hypothetical protein
MAGRKITCALETACRMWEDTHVLARAHSKADTTKARRPFNNHRRTSKRESLGLIRAGLYRRSPLLLRGDGAVISWPDSERNLAAIVPKAKVICGHILLQGKDLEPVLPPNFRSPAD